MSKNGDPLAQLLREPLVIRRPLSLGTPERPRRCTDPRVDEAAWSVALAILAEQGQDPDQLFKLYRVRLLVRSDGRRCQDPGDRASVVAYEWDAVRVINDRIWDWWRNHAHQSGNRDSRLGRGRMSIDLFSRCHKSCQHDHVNLLHASAARRTPCRLVACPTSGMVHLCRADLRHCHSRDQSEDTGITCLESGRIIDEAGRASTHPDANFDWSRRKHAVFCGVESRRRHDASDPENARRASAIDGLERDGCPHIVAWEPTQGELILDLTLPPRSSTGAASAGEPGGNFDPSFLWCAQTGKIRGQYGPDESLGDVPPTTATSPIESLCKEGAAWRKGRERQNRSRRAAQARRRQQWTRGTLVSSIGSTGHLAGSLEDRERATIERVLDDVLWDASTRRRINAQARKQSIAAAQQALTQRMRGPVAKTRSSEDTASAPPVVSSLLRALADRSSVTEGTDKTETKPCISPAISTAARAPTRDTQVMTMSRLAQTVIGAVRGSLVPIAPPDSRRHRQLTLAISYLWGYVVHQPPLAADAGMESDPTEDQQQGPSGNSKIAPLELHKRQRRNTELRTSTLVQFTLGFLYTAADCGVDVGHNQAWPRDWWLHTHLPAIKTLRHYGGGPRGTLNSNRLRQSAKATEATAGDRLTVGLLSPTAGHRSASPPRPPRDLGTYQTKDISAGKRVLSASVRDYQGEVPTAAEVAAYLRQCHAGLKPEKKSAGTGQTLPTGGLTLGTVFGYPLPRPRPPIRVFPRKPSVGKNGVVPLRSTQQQQHTSKRRGLKRKATSTSTSMQQVHVAPGNGAVRFCCLFSTADRAHLCVSFHPFASEKAPPGLSPTAVQREGWKLDTVVGPFVDESMARKFCVEWARPLCTHMQQRREYGKQLAHQVGLEAWFTPRETVASPLSAAVGAQVQQKEATQPSQRQQARLRQRANKARQMYAAMQSSDRSPPGPAPAIRSTQPRKRDSMLSLPAMDAIQPLVALPPPPLRHRYRNRGSGVFLHQWTSDAMSLG